MLRRYGGHGGWGEYAQRYALGQVRGTLLGSGVPVNVRTSKRSLKRSDLEPLSVRLNCDSTGRSKVRRGFRPNGRFEVLAQETPYQLLQLPRPLRMHPVPRPGHGSQLRPGEVLQHPRPVVVPDIITLATTHEKRRAGVGLP